MSELYLKQEIRKLVRNSTFKADIKMVCPIVKIMNMKYENMDNEKIRKIASEVISQV